MIAPLPSIQSSRAPNLMASNHRHISPTSSPRSRTNGLLPAGMNSCRGTGGPISNRSPQPPDLRSPAHAYQRPQSECSYDRSYEHSYEHSYDRSLVHLRSRYPSPLLSERQSALHPATAQGGLGATVTPMRVNSNCCMPLRRCFDRSRAIPRPLTSQSCAQPAGRRKPSISDMSTGKASLASGRSCRSRYFTPTPV